MKSRSVHDMSTVKALLSPWGAYLILYLPEGGLIERGCIREGAYSQNQVTRIYLVALFCEFCTVSYSGCCAEQVADFPQGMLVFVLHLRKFLK